jgi:hypothetical protein
VKFKLGCSTRCDWLLPHCPVAELFIPSSTLRRPSSRGVCVPPGATLHVRGQALVNDLVAALTELPGVDAVLADDANFDGE